MTAPKMFLTTVPKRLGGETLNLLTFNINIYSIKKSYFWFLRLPCVIILKIKIQMHLDTVVKNILGPSWPPMSNRVKN